MNFGQRKGIRCGETDRVQRIEYLHRPLCPPRNYLEI